MGLPLLVLVAKLGVALAVLVRVDAAETEEVLVRVRPVSVGEDVCVTVGVATLGVAEPLGVKVALGVPVSEYSGVKLAVLVVLAFELRVVALLLLMLCASTVLVGARANSSASAASSTAGRCIAGRGGRGAAG